MKAIFKFKFLVATALFATTMPATAAVGDLIEKTIDVTDGETTTQVSCRYYIESETVGKKTVSVGGASRTTTFFTDRKVSGSFEIPSTIEADDGTIYTVTTIEPYAFDRNYYITNVTLPETVTYIGMYSFSDCIKLVSINFPAALTTLYGFAFYRCSSLLEADLSKCANLTTIWQGVFEYCSALTKISLPPSIDDIMFSAFQGCTSLVQEIELPETLTDLGISAFQNSGITKVVIPKSVTTIHHHTFYNCPNLKEAIINANNTVLESVSFSYCDNLETVVINGNVNVQRYTYIVYPISGRSYTAYYLGPFSYSGLKNVTFTTSTKIPDYLFYGCTGTLENIVYEAGLTEIGDYAFCGTSGTDKLVFPNSLWEIGTKAFGTTYSYYNDRGISTEYAMEYPSEVGCTAYDKDNVYLLTANVNEWGTIGRKYQLKGFEQAQLYWVSDADTEAKVATADNVSDTQYSADATGFLVYDKNFVDYENPYAEGSTVERAKLKIHCLDLTDTYNETLATGTNGMVAMVEDNDTEITPVTNKYLIYDNEFYKMNSGTAFPRGKAYLDLAMLPSVSSDDVSGLSIVIGSDETLDIDNVLNSGETEANEPWYTIQGVRIAKPSQAGIYIHGGKKVVIK